MKDKNYWYDKYAPKPHSKEYWKSQYDNTVLHDQQYYLDHYVNETDEPKPKQKNKKDTYTWNNFRSGEQIIFLIALFIFLITRFK